MKKHLTYIKPFISLVLIVFLLISCDQKRPEPNQTPSPSTNQKREQIELNTNAPIEYSLYVKLHSAPLNAYAINGAPLPKQAFVEPIIPIDALSKYLDQNNIKGFRFYPGLQNGSIVTIICQADTADTGNEYNYLILNKSQYSDAEFTDLAQNPTPQAEASKLYRSFLTQVTAYGTSQQNLKRSRLYTVKDFKRLLFDNSDNNPASVKIGCGYVDSNICSNLAARLNNCGKNIPYVKDNEMLGFTVLISLMNASNIDLLDSNDTATNPITYNNRALEVGTPCPPRCGALQNSAQTK